jgi:hypothetical protein
MRACSSHVRYGLDCEAYDGLLAIAKHRCQLCGDDYALVIDHDHGVGDWAVRGVLCSDCNTSLHRMTGRKVDRYLANPWHTSHPHHPVKPTQRLPGDAAVASYAELDRLAEEFANASKQERAKIRAAAEPVALALLRDQEMPTRVAARSPFSAGHLRIIARRAGIGPARPGVKQGYRLPVSY